MKDLVEFLQNAAQTGEVITVAYSGGSRPGESRALSVASCSETELRAYEGGGRIQKQYKVAKVLWAEDSSGRRVTSQQGVQAFQAALPVFESLQQYAEHLLSEFENAGWHVHQAADSFGVGTRFKNGTPKKTPSIAISFIDRSIDAVWDLEANDLVEVKKEPTGRERPWRVDSWRMKEGKAFDVLHSAIELFVSEVRASDPQNAKGMWAGRRYPLLSSTLL